MTQAFAFDGILPGRYTLSADKTGFLQTRYGARLEGSPAVQLTIAPGDRRKGLDLKMTPQGVIVGRVLDQDGDPVANARITVARYGYTNGRRTLLPASGSLAPGAAVQAVLGGGGQKSDDQGAFRISNLAPGPYYISADARTNRGFTGLIAAAQGPPAEAAPDAINIVTCYPNSPGAYSVQGLTFPGLAGLTANIAAGGGRCPHQ